METPAETKKLLKHFLRRLTNLSGNNRSLYLGRLAADQFLDLHETSQLNREKSFALIEAIIDNRRKIVCPVLDPRMEASNEVSKKLKKLQRLDQFLFEERGSRDLHIGWPFVRGKMMNGTCVSCPLLFFPVEIILENGNWLIRPREDDDIGFNKTFLLAYALHNGVKIDESLLEENFEETDRDSTVFRTALYQMVTKGVLDINFNSDNYRDELTSFTPFKKETFEKEHRNGELKLFPEGVLGIFPQAGSYLVPDYTHLIDNDKITDLEEFFHQRNPAGISDSRNYIKEIKEERIYAPFPMDAWQENALKAVKLGHSVVVQGPPGTGKSQLICNLISDALSHQKRVMVVCQKRAALDVVYSRLKEKKLGSFIGLVHDFRNDRRIIYDKIAAQIDQLDDFKVKNNSLDSIQLERSFYQASRQIDQITDELEEFKKALFDEKEAGISIKDLYLRSNPSAPAINLKQEYQYIKHEESNTFLTKLKGYAFYADRFENSNYPWKERKSFAALKVSDYKTLQQLLTEIPAYFQHILAQIQEMSSARLNWLECETLTGKKSVADEILELIGTPERYATFQTLMAEPDDETSALWLSNIERVIAECYQRTGPEITTPANELGHLQNALQRSMKVRRNVFRLIQWELFSKDKIFITRTLIANGLKSNKAGLLALEEKLDNRLNLEHNLSKLRSRKWLLNIPDGYSLTAFQRWTQNIQRAIKAKELFRSLRGLKNIADPSRLSWIDFKFRIERLFQLFEELPLKLAIWQNYFTPAQLSVLTQTNNLSAEWSSVLKNDFDALVEFDRQREGLHPDERLILDKLNQGAKSWDAEALAALFINSWCLAWIEHIETKHPVLSIVSSGKLGILETTLRAHIREKQKISDDILLLRAREQVMDNLEFNRLNNLVTYRNLSHQVTKKKRIWPLRKVVAEFTDELFRVIPCWLVSPETVSTIFPMQEVFDLVIFDEASQCFAERGIPAMYRAKQIVVAGDEQQLRPNDLYQSHTSEEEVEHPDQDVDSLLELCGRYLTGVDLRSHYRSQSLPLIDFSNRHFYQGRLQLLPDRLAVNRPDPPIEYIRLDGVWTDQMNREEAEEVVRLTFQSIQNNPKQSIGIVTFNSPQQNLIQDLLEEKSMTSDIKLPLNLFVKNIENVQGDERDMIIFSVGYAPGKKGKLAAQFGSLNLAGGENRLNVAITRAREKIIMVTSIWPEELQVSQTINPGPKLLKEYLEFARGVSQGNFDPYVASDSSRRASWYLKGKIRTSALEKFRHAEISEDLFPFADLTIGSQRHYTGIILTDDENYYRSLSAKERHASLPELLEQKNWKYIGQFSRNYWQDEEKFLNEVGKFVTP